MAEHNDTSSQPRDFSKQLDKTSLAMPLIDVMNRKQDEQGKRVTARTKFDVIIDLNFSHCDGLAGAKKQALALLLSIKESKDVRSLRRRTTESLIKALSKTRTIDGFKSELCSQYVFAKLTKKQIIELIRRDKQEAQQASEKQSGKHPGGKAKGANLHKLYQQMSQRPSEHDVPDDDMSSHAVANYRYESIYKIWPDFEIEPQLTRTLSTVKADAAQIAFTASGKEIVWAVIDSGIEHDHPHFQLHSNLDLSLPLRHADFTVDTDDEKIRHPEQPTDPYGHGTHVAGIIAGEIRLGNDKSDDEQAEADRASWPTAVKRIRDENGDANYLEWKIDRISGVAPQCKLVSLRVLDERGKDTGGSTSRSSNVIAALAYIHKLNDDGRQLRVHGVNLSVGYQFKAEWFGCGQSPLCIEVDRLVRSGVIVVAAAGNTGYGRIAPSSGGPNLAGLNLTINDPGNSNLAITVGSTHRESPHTYGISYFSSKGPTGDGRLKPDLVAPGENVLSCAAGREKADIDKRIAENKQVPVADLDALEQCRYREESGTSMATPHVSGSIAAFLSVKREFRGDPERVKQIFLANATDLGRERYFQGNGLVDLMRSIQAV